MTRRVLWVLAGLMMLAETSPAQRVSNWRVYKPADGMAEPGCASVTIGPHVRVWTRHWDTNYASMLDGYTIETVAMPALGHTRVYESPGGQLWTSYPEGLEEYRDGRWRLYPVREIANETRSNALPPLHPVPLCPFRQGRVIYLLPNALRQFSIEKAEQPETATLREASRTALEKFQGMTMAHDGGLWIAGARGLARLPGPARLIKADTEWREYLAPESLDVQNLQEPLEDERGGVMTVADDRSTHQRVAVYFDGQEWTKFPVGGQRIRAAWRSSDNRFWAVTIDTLLQLQPGTTEPMENEDLPARRYFDVAEEPGGAFWLATSDGLFRYAPRIWQTPDLPLAANARVQALQAGDEGGMWLGTSNALYLARDNRVVEFPLPSRMRAAFGAGAGLWNLPGGALLMNGADGLIQFDLKAGRFSEIPALEQGQSVRPAGICKDGTLCVQIAGTNNPNPALHLETYDGRRFRPALFPADPGLEGPVLTFFTAQNGDAWASTTNGTAWHHEGAWTLFRSGSDTAPQAVIQFIELQDSGIWCATADKLWEFNGHAWSLIRSGFDRINGILRSRDGSVWVASNSGLLRYFRGAWIESGTEDGLPATMVLQITEDSRGSIWVNTTRGLSIYHPEADPDPPHSVARLVEGKNDEVAEGAMATVAYGGHDKWKYTTGDRLLYSYRLDQEDWTPFWDVSRATFADLTPGKHSFQARVMDRNGNLDPKPPTFEFAVTLPWYREARVVWTSCAGLGLALFFAGLAFNRHMRLVRSHAEVERKVKERTRQLEMANRELLHSQKMNALGTLAAGIAHDFNNIFSIIKGSAQIIEDNLDNPQKVSTRVDRIKTVVEQGSGIVGAMLGFSRGSEDRPAMCDLNKTVEETVRLLGDRFLRDVKVNLRRASDLPEVRASPDLVQQILLNLIFNAAEAFTESREVVLTTGKAMVMPAGVVLPPAKSAAYAFAAVQDFGCGISSEVLPRIFEPFFTTKAMSTRRGTGLGLSMVYQLAEKMGAGLAVETAVGQGSTFTLILAVAEKPAPVAPAATPVQTSTH